MSSCYIPDNLYYIECRICGYSSYDSDTLCVRCVSDLEIEKSNAEYEEERHPSINYPAEYELRKNVKFPRKSTRLNRKVKKRQHFTIKWRENSIITQFNICIPSITISYTKITNIAAESYLLKRANRKAKQVKTAKDKKLRKGRGKNKQKKRGIQKQPRKIFKSYE